MTLQDLGQNIRYVLDTMKRGVEVVSGQDGQGKVTYAKGPGPRVINTGQRRPSTDSSQMNQVPTTPYDQQIEQGFGDQSGNARRVLRYTNPQGEVHGENTGYQIGPEVDMKNNDGSIDRGLYRINSNTFADFQKRKPDLLKGMGINNYEDMYDPMKNINMARMIYDEQGWDAWYAAPPDLRSK